MKPMPGMVGGMSGSILRGTATVADTVVGSTVGECKLTNCIASLGVQVAYAGQEYRSDLF